MRDTTTPISSRDNKLIKEAAALATPSGRRKLGKYVLEGAAYLHPGVEYVLISEGCASAHTLPLAQYRGHLVEDALFSKISDTKTSQGILGICPIPRYSPMDVLLSGDVFVVCEDIRDPGNMGSIIRTAAVAGIGGVFALKGCTEAYSPKAVRSSAGAVFHVPVCEGMAPDDLLGMLRQTNTRTLAAHLFADRAHHEVDMRGRIAFLVGNEAGGLSDTLSAASDIKLKIPMPGAPISLNAGTAAAILVYEALRQNQA